MASLTFFFKIAFEGAATLICIILAIIVYLRSRKNLPNIYMATAFLLYGIYTGGVLIYDVFATGPLGDPSDIFITIFIRVSLISILFGGMCLYFSMMGQGHSAMWYTFKKNIYPWIGIVIIYSLVLIGWTKGLFGIPSDWIEIVSYQPVDTTLILYVLIPLILLLIIFFIRSSIVLYNYGVKKSEGLRKHNMQRFLIGVVIAISGIIINVLGQIGAIGGIALGPSLTLSQILDLVFFALIVVSVIVIFTGLAIRSKRKMSVE